MASRKTSSENKKTKAINMDEILELLHEHAETGFIHTTYQDETKRFRYLINGDKRAITDAVNIMEPTIQGTLSKDPLRNMRYLFIVNTGLATRYLIEAGIPQETVYSISDIYIQKADVAKSIDEIRELNKEVWTIFVETVREHKKENQYSRHILECLNYIDSHFNEKITLELLAEKVNLNPSYLATLFRKETGNTLGTYLMNIRIKASQALLTRTDYSYSQIAYSMGFCSQSHFTAAFRKISGLTPKEYRVKYYNKSISISLPSSD